MIREIRLLPPLTIARLGSATVPMENYDVRVDPNDPLGFRKLTPARTLIVNRSTGAITRAETPENVRFKRGNRVKPICPFLEVWCDRGDGVLRPLTAAILAEEGLAPADVRWRARAGNVKAFRRTRDENDRILADTGTFSAHRPQELIGRCPNFVEGKTITFGDVHYIRPSDEFPEIRLRFTPGKGLVYGATKNPRDDRVNDVVYDSNRGRWSRHRDSGPLTTAPGSIFAGENINGRWVSRGYLDDACDGIVEVEIGNLRSFARIASGPPDYAPDSLPVRTVADELEQALLGPTVDPSQASPEVTEEIVRRAFETIRLQHTAGLNGNRVHGERISSMPAHDTGLGRRFDPIMAPALVDNLAVRNLHQSIYAALKSDTAAWFGEVLRDYDEVGDLTDRGRRKMPAMMRGSDGLYMALTRRQIDTIRKASARRPVANVAMRMAMPAPVEVPAAPPEHAAIPLNQTAAAHFLETTPSTSDGIAVAALVEQLGYRAAGNPPGTLLTTAISNCFPGLEFDFRNIWKRFFIEIELHESDNLVVSAASALENLVGRRLMRVRRGDETIELTTRVFGPAENGGELELTGQALEYSNLFTTLMPFAGQKVRAEFADANGAGRIVTRELTIRGLFAPGTAAIAEDVAQPGEMGQSLCSPWQNDYRECGCYYWAATRPDYVNVEPGPEGISIGHNWLQFRGANVAKDYLPDPGARPDPAFISYDDLFRRWEEVLTFEIEGKDSE